MDEEIRQGYYRDADGNWQKDRRKASDRRRLSGDFPHRDRRTWSRRKADLEIMERDTRQQIEEALEDFASEHDGHV